MRGPQDKLPQSMTQRRGAQALPANGMQDEHFCISQFNAFQSVGNTSVTLWSVWLGLCEVRDAT